MIWVAGVVIVVLAGVLGWLLATGGAEDDRRHGR